MAEVEIDAIGLLHHAEQLDDQGLVAFDQAKNSQHQARFRRHPHLLGDARPPISTPTAFQPAEVSEFNGGNLLSLRRRWKWIDGCNEGGLRLRIRAAGLLRAGQRYCG